MLKMMIVLQQSLAAQIAVWTRRGRRSRRFGIWALLIMAITLTRAQACQGSWESVPIRHRPAVLLGIGRMIVTARKPPRNRPRPRPQAPPLVATVVHAKPPGKRRRAPEIIDPEAEARVAEWLRQNIIPPAQSLTDRKSDTGTQRHAMRIGKVRRTDNNPRYVSAFLADHNSPQAPVVMNRDYAPPKDTVKQLKRLLRQWESHPVTTQAEFDERVKARSVAYNMLPPKEQREIDRKLGILHWKG